MNTSGSILIVDDDPDIRFNFADILTELGYRISTAADGQTALEQVREQHFDVVLLDYKMPGMDGATLYNEIKKLRPSIVAIMVTAWAGSDGAQRALSAGTWEVLRKPVNIPVLLEKLRQAINAPIILVVDDDEDFCQSLWEVLNHHRYRVVLAHSEGEGVRQAGESDCQVAIVDLRLGQGDGRNVLHRLHASCPEAKTILVTGHLQKAALFEQQRESYPFHAFCSKPIDVNRLLELIRS